MVDGQLSGAIADGEFESQVPLTVLRPGDSLCIAKNSREERARRIDQARLARFFQLLGLSDKFMASRIRSRCLTLSVQRPVRDERLDHYVHYQSGLENSLFDWTSAGGDVQLDSGETYFGLNMKHVSSLRA